MLFLALDEIELPCTGLVHFLGVVLKEQIPVMYRFILYANWTWRSCSWSLRFWTLPSWATSMHSTCSCAWRAPGNYNWSRMRQPLGSSMLHLCCMSYMNLKVHFLNFCLAPLLIPHYHLAYQGFLAPNSPVIVAAHGLPYLIFIIMVKSKTLESMNFCWSVMVEGLWIQFCSR